MLETNEEIEMMELSLQNGIYCHTCNKVLMSRHQHDFNQCDMCGGAVDGGEAYCRRVTPREGTIWENIGIYLDSVAMFPDRTYLFGDLTDKETMDQAVDRLVWGVFDAVHQKTVFVHAKFLDSPHITNIISLLHATAENASDRDKALCMARIAIMLEIQERRADGRMAAPLSRVSVNDYSTVLHTLKILKKPLSYHATFIGLDMETVHTRFGKPIQLDFSFMDIKANCPVWLISDPLTREYGVLGYSNDTWWIRGSTFYSYYIVDNLVVRRPRLENCSV